MSVKGEEEGDIRMTFGQFEAHLGRNKRNELGTDGTIGGDKTWRWRFRRSWLEKGIPGLVQIKHEEDLR